MTEDPTPTTLRRQLGARLRQLRQQRGLTAQQIADALGFSISKVSRMESGARAVNEQDLAALLAHYEVDAALATELTDTARAARRRRGWAPHVPVPDSDFHQVVESGFVELERDAERVREFNSGVVPGLLQSRAYMRAMMEAVAPDEAATVERAVALRLGRQERLDRGGRYETIVDEAVLARVVGDAAVMREQVELVVARAKSGAADVRVIPFSAGFHSGLNSVFVALDMGGTGAPDTVFIEGLIGFQSFDRPEDVGRFDRIWSELKDIAASRDESCAILNRYVRYYAERVA